MKPRASWVVLIVVLLVTLILPGLRDIVNVGLHVREYYLSALGRGQAGAFGARFDTAAVRAVLDRAPDDPEVLLGAGILLEARGPAPIRAKAAEVGKSGAAWSSYVDALMASVPPFSSAADWGDPSDPRVTAGAREFLAQERARGLPDHLQPADVAPVMEALRAWEAADPQNGLPSAFEANYLVSTGQTEAGLARFEAAAAAGRADGYDRERTRAVAEVLTRMGRPAPEASLTATMLTPLPGYARMRSLARAAQYQGYLARMAGRDAEAVRWWKATADLGRVAENSAPTPIGYLVGSAIEGIGAAPTWKWRMVAGGPLLGGAYYYGPYHAIYEAQMGAAQSAALRDRLVQGKLRTALLRARQTSGDLTARFWPWINALEMSLLALSAVLLALLAFLAVGSWRGREAERATKIAPCTAVALALLGLIPLAIGMMVHLSRSGLVGIMEGENSLPPLFWGAAVTVVVSALLPLLAALGTRVRGMKLVTAWRGNLRSMLPAAAAVCALIYLASGLVAAHQRSVWVTAWKQGKIENFAGLTRSLGKAWENPTVLAGAWYDAYPPPESR